MSDTKLCNYCDQEKEIALFELTGHGYLRNICRKCRHKRKKPKHLARTYGVSYQHLLMIKESQDYRCAICGTHDENTTRGLVIDHDHDTNKVRGYLCEPCNRGIGFLRENTKVLAKAIEYLNKPLS